MFVHEGYPNHIVTDNSVQFTSHEIKDYFAERGIVHSTSALYHPQANGLVVPMNRTIKEGIQLATLQHKDPVLATKERLFSYHTTPHSMTEKSPFELILGRVAKTKLYTLGSKASSKFQKIQKLVCTKQAKAYDSQKQDVKLPDIKPGDFVKILNQRHIDKGKMWYFLPQKVISVNVSCIVLENGKKWNGE